jgi:hypothetical protein
MHPLSEEKYSHLQNGMYCATINEVLTENIQVLNGFISVYDGVKVY